MQIESTEQCFVTLMNGDHVLTVRRKEIKTNLGEVLQALGKKLNMCWLRFRSL